MRHGFDVAEFNPPKLIPWHTRDFGCVRLTTGIDLDLRADEHLRRASGAGVGDLLVYAYLKGSQLGEAQARCLLDRAHTLEDVEHVGPLALAIDVEDPFEGPPWHRPTYAKILIDTFDWLAAHTSRAVVLYVSPAYVAELLAAAPHLASTLVRMPLWLADWTPPASVPAPWKRWTIWQHAVKPPPDLALKIDHDVFDGTSEDWRRVMHPDPHDELAGIVTTTREASGHGPGGVQDFASVDEGPRFDR